jgi:hypothetical protein
MAFFAKSGEQRIDVIRYRWHWRNLSSEVYQMSFQRSLTLATGVGEDRDVRRRGWSTAGINP